MTPSLTLLLESPVSLPVAITGVNGKRLRIHAPKHVALGTPVRVSAEEKLWLGTVVEVQADGSAVIEIAHALANITDLARVADRFLGKGEERYSDSLCPSER